MGSPGEMLLSHHNTKRHIFSSHYMPFVDPLNTKTTLNMFHVKKYLTKSTVTKQFQGFLKAGVIKNVRGSTRLNYIQFRKRCHPTNRKSPITQCANTNEAQVKYVLQTLSSEEKTEFQNVSITELYLSLCYTV